MCIAAYWILYSEFGLVSCNDLFFDVSNGQLRCKVNRTSSKFTALNLNTVERSEACVHLHFEKLVHLTNELLPSYFTTDVVIH